MNLRLLAAAALGLTVGCTSPPPPGPAPTAQARDVAAEAMAALDRAEWARAADLLRQALREEPTSVKLHYHLAVAGTHLDRRDEAIREFRWVIANADPELPEAQQARRWLTTAGVLARPEPDPAESRRADQTAQQAPDNTGLTGQVVEAPGQSTARLQLFLKGEPKTPFEGLQWVRRTDDSGRFEFKKIPAGTYMLTDRLAGEPMWRLRVKLAPGETTTIQLSEANSAKVRDDFPGS